MENQDVLEAVREQLRMLGCDIECSDELIVDFLRHLVCTALTTAGQLLLRTACGFHYARVLVSILRASAYAHENCSASC